MVAQEWLRRQSDLTHVGDVGEGPPDFLAEFHGVEVAIEVTRLPLGTGMAADRRIAFEAVLQEIVQAVKDDPEAPRWHVLCYVDDKQSRPPRLREALLGGSGPGRLQLMAESERVGEGVVVEYWPASNDGSLPFVNQLGAYWVVGTASTRIVEQVCVKAAKVRRSARARAYSDWWLILHDEVVVDPDALDAEEWRGISDAVAASEDIALWSKVILLSRYTGGCTVVYERPGQRGLGEGTQSQ